MPKNTRKSQLDPESSTLFIFHILSLKKRLKPGERTNIWREDLYLGKGLTPKERLLSERANV